MSNGIDERFNMKYIGYYSNGGFCQIHTQKSQLKIWVNLDIHDITDPLSLCRNVRKIGHYGTGNTEIVLKSFDELNAVFDIIQQAYKKNVGLSEKTLVNEGSQDTRKLRKKFWTQLLKKANQRTTIHANISPRDGNRIIAGAGKKGLAYAYVVRMHDAHVELYIDNGNRRWNKTTFKFFYQRKDEIERIFGTALDWQLQEEKRASRIRYMIFDYGLKDQNFWPELQDLLIDNLIRLKRTINLIQQIYILPHSSRQVDN